MKRNSRQFVVACSTLAVLGSLLSADAPFAWASAQANGVGSAAAGSGAQQAPPSGAGAPASRVPSKAGQRKSPSSAASSGQARRTAVSNLSNGSIAGIIRDASGTPQPGIEVELLRADLTTAAFVFTDHNGGYSIGPVVPGQYSLRAMGGSFIAALKPDLRVSANTVVNLTVNTLYDLMQWAPVVQRPRPQNDDDWAWTLRSPENRPLLRWQEDGSPVLVWSGPNPGSGKQASADSRRASSTHQTMRVRASAGEKHFASGAQQISFAAQNGADDSGVIARRRMLVSADLSPNVSPGQSLFGDGMPGAVMDAMLGFRQQMTNSGMGSSSVQTVAAVLSDPAAGSGPQQGLEALSLRTWESLQVLNSLEAEAGSDQVVARLGDGSELMAALPFANFALHRGKDSFEYRVSTAPEPEGFAGFDDAGGEGGREAMASTWLPVVSERSGRLTLEHGLHQEFGWSREAGPAQFTVVVFNDRMENPVIQASGHLSAGENATQAMLQDGASGMLRAAGPGYSAGGVAASVESRLGDRNRVKISYATGGALMLHSVGRPEDVATILSGVVPRRTQLYEVELSGAAGGQDTRWRVSYRGQPASAITGVAPFTIDPNSPYLSAFLRQRLWTDRQSPRQVDAQLDLDNLLAQGYQVFVTSDGSHLYFAQAPRRIAGGLEFVF